MTSIESRVVRKLHVYVLLALLICQIFNNLDRVNVSFAAFTMSPEVGLSDVQFGLGAGMFFVSYALLAIPSNLALQRLGAKIWFPFMLISCGLTAAAMAAIQGSWSFYVVRFLFGAAEAGLTPGFVLYVTYWYPQGYRAFAYSVLTASIPFVGIIAGPFSVLIIESLNGFWGLSGWRWMFILQGLPLALLGVLMVYWLTDVPWKADWLDVNERDWLMKRLDAERPTASEGSFKDAIRSARVWLLAAIYFMFLIGFYGLQLWMPQIIKVAGQTNTTSASVLSAGPSVVAGVFTLLLGFSSDRTGERRLHLALPLLFGGMLLVLTTYLIDRPWLAYSVFCFAWGLLFAPVGIFWTVAGVTLTGTAAAAGLAFITSFGQLGGFVGPYAIGVLREATGQFSAAVIFSGCVAVLAGSVALALKPHRAPSR